LLRKDYFLIVQDNNDNYFLAGFRNGLTAEKLEQKSNQYTINFVGQEEEFAPYVNDLMGTTFIVIGEIDDYYFQDGDNYYFQDDYNYIFQ